MPWLLLLASAVLEAVWATALGQSDGLRDPAMVTGAETFTPVKALQLVGIVGAVIGLQLLPSPSDADDTGPPRLEG